MKVDEIHLPVSLRLPIVTMRLRMWLLASMMFAAVGAPGSAARAEPSASPSPSSSPMPPGLSAEFADLCGLVRIDATYVGQGFATMELQRNGAPVPNGTFNVSQVGGGPFQPPQPISHYQYAGDGDTMVLTWVFAGVAHREEHTHRAPQGCAEPKLSFQLAGNCDIRSKLLIGNSGKGSIDLFIQSDPGIYEVAVPPGGTQLSMLGGQLSTGVERRVFISTTHPRYENQQLLIDILDRPACDGPAEASRPENPQSVFEVTCGRVSVAWINGKHALEGVLRLYRNGSLAAEQQVARGEIHQFQLTAADGDTIAVGGPDGPYGNYTYRQANARCAGNLAAGRLPATGVAVGSLILGAACLVGIGMFVRRAGRRRRFR